MNAFKHNFIDKRQNSRYSMILFHHLLQIVLCFHRAPGVPPYPKKHSHSSVHLLKHFFIELTSSNQILGLLEKALRGCVVERTQWT